jgi:predicted RNA-binding Zn ribbon-like protein
MCLDFMNTVGDHASASPREFLNSYGDLLAWSVRAEVVSRRDSRVLEARAGREPTRAQAALARAIEVRETLYRIFAAFAHGRTPSRSDLAAFNAALYAETSRRVLAHTGSGFEWTWARGADLDAMLGPVLQSAAELLASDAAERVGQCASVDGCGWFFVDTSHAHKRKWCDMNDCGNRAKARRHYARVKNRGQVRATND